MIATSSMKRWIFQILAVLVLATSAGVYTFEEPTWLPVQLRDHSDHLPGLERRLEFIHVDRLMRHGTPMIHLDLRNLQTSERTFTVELAPSELTSISRQLVLPPNGTASMVLPGLLVNHDYGMMPSIAIRETTPGVPSRIGNIDVLGFQFCFGTSEHPSILMAAALSPESFIKNLTETAITNTNLQSCVHFKVETHPSEFHCGVLRFHRPAKDWPDDYRVYSTFDAVVVTPSLFAAFPPSVRQALDDFAAFGGAVLVTPDDTESGGLADRQIQERFRLAIENAQERLDIKTYDAKYALESVPLDIKHSLPLNLLIALLGIFAVGFVPFATGVCIYRNRCFHALVIIPAAAAAMAMVVGISSFVFYGTTPTERLQSVTILDQRTHHAVTRGQFAVFAPSPESRELSFPLDSTFMQQVYDDSIRHSERRLSIEIGDHYHLVGDWVQPLIPTLFEFQRVAQRSERLDVKTIGTNEIQVVNLLGVPIVNGRLRLRNYSYSLDGLQPGETKTLKALVRTSENPPQDSADEILFSVPEHCRHWGKLVKHLNRPELALPESTYFAIVEGSPFFPSPYGKRRTHSSQKAVVVGQFAEGTK